MSKELIVGPFPHGITLEEKKLFLSYFGAHVVHDSPKKKRYVIAKFLSHKDCEYALKKIHQSEILGIRLIALYFNKKKQHSFSSSKDSRPSSGDYSNNKSSPVRAAVLNYEAQLLAISYNYDLNNPIPPGLKYLYPPPTPSVLCNIVHALVGVPKFYYQTLHLMNKMNLPSPFGQLTVEPPLYEELKTLSSVFRTQKVSCASSLESSKVSQSRSDSESELESDGEAKLLCKKGKFIPPNRIKRQNKIKKPRLETLKHSFLPPKDSTIRPQSTDSCQTVFDMPKINPVMKLSLNLSTSHPLGSESFSEAPVSVGFGKLYPPSKNGKLCDQEMNNMHALSEEISRNRIPESDWPLVPVFKNYNRGIPSPRLYIKNLAKSVTEADLNLIFRKFIDTSEKDFSRFSIRLMKEGRMKGQAFITYACIEEATVALQAVNGYILKDKPMVVVFGKNKTDD